MALDCNGSVSDWGADNSLARISVAGLQWWPSPAAKNSLSWSYKEVTLMANSLTPGERLNPGLQLKSPNGLYALTMYDHGLLVLSGGPTTVVEPSNGAVPGSYAELREGGNFVIYVPDGSRTTWESGPGGPGDLVLHNTGRITIGTSILVGALADRPHDTLKPTSTSIGNSLSPGGRLEPGFQLKSSNSLYALAMTDEGQLEFSGGPNSVKVPSDGAVPNSYAELLEGGNLVIFVPDRSRTTWESGPRGPGDLVVKDDGHITIGDNRLI
jgi:hypothetical protein